MSVAQATRFGVEAIQDEAKRLVRSGAVRPSATIGHLQAFFPAREWEGIAEELEILDYQCNDAICDLIGCCDEWCED